MLSITGLYWIPLICKAQILFSAFLSDLFNFCIYRYDVASFVSHRMFETGDPVMYRLLSTFRQAIYHDYNIFFRHI